MTELNGLETSKSEECSVEYCRIQELPKKSKKKGQSI